MNKKAFTLLELLVVVLIIGILAGIALPQYKIAVGKAKFATLKNDAHIIKNAEDRYYLVHGNFINKLGNLDVEIKSNCNVNGLDNPMISCAKVIFGSEMNYMLGFGFRDHQQACFITSNPTNQYANKICQQETGKKTPREDSTRYKAYYY